MKISTKYFIFTFLIISALFIISLPFAATKPYLFLAVEILIILAVVFSFIIYRSLIRPIKTISNGIENIKDKDFGTKLNYVNQREMDKLIDVYNKMIEQLRHERILHEEQNLFLDKLIEASPSGIIILDLDGKITEVNESAEKYLGLTRSALVGRKLNTFNSDLFKELNGIKENESKTIKLSGINVILVQKAHFIHKGSKQHFLIIEELTEEILKAEKKSYDKIIRMMSHEINNSIGAVNSILNSFQNYSPQLNNEDAGDFNNAINVAIDRNVKLNKFMTNFADVVRIPPPRKTRYNVFKLISDVISLMKPVCYENNIEIVLSQPKEEFHTNLDPQQMEQVLVNIIKNSIEAIGKDGKIEIDFIIDRSSEIIIRDNGAGIDANTKSFLFTPFFSTKKSGQGVGLTLIREILVNHGFTFSLQTLENNLTEFRIMLNH